MSQAGTTPRRLVALSTASVYPDRTPDAFEVAARLGYDGVEVMVTPDAVSQDVEVLRRLADYHSVPVLAVHAPCLLITQRVWGREPWGKLVRAKDVAEELGARVVVVHPAVPLAARLRPGLRGRPGPDAGRDRRAVRGGEHVPAPGAGRRGGAVRAVLEPGPDGLPARHAGSVAHGRVRVRRAGHGRRARQPAGPRAPRRRHRAGQPRRAPGPRPRHPAVRAAAAPAGRRGLPGAWSCWRSRPFRAPTQEARQADLAEALEFARANLASPRGGPGGRSTRAAPAGAAPPGPSRRAAPATPSPASAPRPGSASPPHPLSTSR